MIEKLKWWYWRRYKHQVHYKEISWILRRDKCVFVLGRTNMVFEYASGDSIADIAERHNVTRERVRQIMFTTWSIHNGK